MKTNEQSLKAREGCACIKNKSKHYAPELSLFQNCTTCTTVTCVVKENKPEDYYLNIHYDKQREDYIIKAVVRKRDVASSCNKYLVTSL